MAQVAVSVMGVHGEPVVDERFNPSREKTHAELVARGITVVRISWRQITREGVATAALLAVALARAVERR